MIRNFRSQIGFTLIEMIVALAVFSVVVTIAVGALLMLIASNEQLQAEQSVMTNLSFALDSMTREIRTGTAYFCYSANSLTAGASGEKIFDDGEILSSTAFNDCADGNNLSRTYHGMSFIEGGHSITQAADTRIVFFFDSSEGKIFRRVSGQNAQSIVSSGIFIEEAEFYVTGSEPLSTLPVNTEQDQASVTIYIKARPSDDLNSKPYVIQTSITQRTLDI